MRDVLPTTSMLTVFDTVITCGGFSRAAAQLNLSPASVSYTIKSLEALLGVRLFDRQPDGVYPTQDAFSLIDDARDALDQIRKFRDKGIIVGSGARQIRILSSQAIATLWLMPRMGELMDKFSDCRLELISWVGGRSNQHFDETPGIDFEIRWMKADETVSAVNSALISIDSAKAVCSPDYLQKIGGRLSLETVSKTTIIHSLTWPNIWEKWSECAFGRNIKSASEIRLQHTGLCIQAAQNGVGVAIVHSPLTQKEITDGSLVVAHDLALQVPEGYVAIQHRPNRDNLFEEFVTWARSHMS